MKKNILLLTSLLISVTLFSQEKMYIHKSDKFTLGALLSKTDSIYFSSNEAITYFKINNSLYQCTTSEIDSISFGDNSSTVYITYNGTSVTVVNPLAFEGVSVTVSGCDVTVTSTNTDVEVNYSLNGTTSDGTLKIYSINEFNLLMNGVSLTNANGPAINIQSKKKCNIILETSTTNTLADGSTYASSSEDQKSTLFSEGEIEFSGAGSLTVISNAKHAICSDNSISILNGNITISGSKKDGVHTNDEFSQSGGSLNITATGDGIECEGGNILISGGTIKTTNTAADVKGITCDSTLVISGGTINMTVSGNQSKGIKSSQQMTLSGGTIVINTSGAAVLEASGSGYDPSYCTGIKSDSTITISGSNITIISTGVAGKGISSDKDIKMTSGTVNITTSGAGATYTNTAGTNDSYASSCVDADGNINILNGNITVSSSGTGGKGITADGDISFGSLSESPTINASTTGTRFIVTGTSGYATADYANPKAIKSDGILTINNGTFTISTTQPGGTGIDSDSTLTITGGTIGITIAGNQTKGISATKLMSLSGGTITINTSGGVALETSGSGFDPSYGTSIKGDENIIISGSKITITSTGIAGKGVSCDGNVSMTSGNLGITTSGAGATYKNSTGTTDSYSASCITANGNINITGGTVTTSSSGLGGKGFSADGTITIGDSSNSPTINITTTGAKFIVSGTDYCHPKAIKCTGAMTINKGTTTITSSDDGMHSEASITINSGTVSITTSYEAIESFKITINGGNVSAIATNDAINATAGTVSGGTEQNDNSLFTMNGGTLYASCANGDAIDSNGSILVTGGTIIANGPANGVEEAADFNETFNMNGGFFVGAGTNSNMNKTMSTSSSQRNIYVLSSTNQIASGSILHIQDASGNDIVTFKPARAYYSILFSSSSLATGVTYSIYTGGTCTGTVSNGLYSGGTYSGGTFKKSFTLSTSSKVTSVSL